MQNPYKTAEKKLRPTEQKSVQKLYFQVTAMQQIAAPSLLEWLKIPASLHCAE